MLNISKFIGWVQLGVQGSGLKAWLNGLLLTVVIYRFVISTAAVNYFNGKTVWVCLTYIPVIWNSVVWRCCHPNPYISHTVCIWYFMNLWNCSLVNRSQSLPQVWVPSHISGLPLFLFNSNTFVQPWNSRNAFSLAFLTGPFQRPLIVTLKPTIILYDTYSSISVSCSESYLFY